jgi:hypothetical protein
MIADSDFSMERYHGSDHSTIPCLYGLEAPDEEKYQMGVELLDVWRHIVSIFCR